MYKRAPIQIAVTLFRIEDEKPMFALFRRIESEGGFWQPITGGVREGEAILDAAYRETAEESGITAIKSALRLETTAMIPREAIGMHDWDISIAHIPEHHFGFLTDEKDIILSDEHDKCGWFNYDDALSMLDWESNRNSIIEINQKIKGGLK